MSEPLTTCQIVNKLIQEGYTANFKARKDGLFVFPQREKIDADTILVEKTFRVEGESDIGDETIILALRCPKTNIKGTYLVAYGPFTLETDVNFLQQLQKKSSSSS